MSAGLLVIALSLAASGASSTSSGSPAAAPCTAGALGLSMRYGALPVMSVQNYGCEGNWAFIWATIGHNIAHAIGVTEVLKFDTHRRQWILVKRAKYCHANMLPSVVYRQGCFSN